MSPLAPHPSALIVLNLPSLDHFESALVPGGLLVLNSSMVNRKPIRNDIHCVDIPANKLAEELQDVRLANIVALGCYVKVSKIVVPDAVQAALSMILKGDKERFITGNVRAFDVGFTWHSD
jgi:2-oxoglutarate ferredoxin oxidoreductase subunit gamma